MIRIAFSENVKPNMGMVLFKGAKSEIQVNVQSASEVRCTRDECVIEPAQSFEEGTYVMSFGETAFTDLSGNVLLKGVSDHVFTVAGMECGLQYVSVDKDQPCFCQSVENQCQCQCGETFFVKDY